MQRLKYVVSVAGLLGLVLTLLLAPWGGLLAAAQTALAPVPVPGGVFGVGVNPTTNRVYVSGGNAVSVIDGSTNAVIGTVPIGGGGAAGVGVNPTTNRIYVANLGPTPRFDANGLLNGGAVSVIDGATNALVATVSLGLGPAGVGVNPATNRIYDANQSDNTVAVIDGSNNTVVATIPVAAAPSAVDVNPTTNRVYVAGQNSVSVIDGGNNTVIAAIPIGLGLAGVAVNASTNRIYVANQANNTIAVIDGSTNVVVNTISVAAFPAGVSVNATTNRVYVASNAVNTFQASTLGSNVLSVIDGGTNTVVATVPVGPTTFPDPFGLAVNPTTNRVYVGNTGDNTLSLTQDVTAAPTPPNVTLAINGGSACTTSASVQLLLTVLNPGTNATQVRFSIDGVNFGPFTALTGASPFTLPFGLPAGDGAKQVFAQASSAAGALSNVASASIVLDTTPPVATFESPTGGLTNNPQPLISILLSDSGSGINVPGIQLKLDGQVVAHTFTAVQTAPDGRVTQGRVTFQPATPLTNAPHTIDLVAPDTCGNPASVVQQQVTVDTVPPQIPPQPADGAPGSAFTLPPSNGGQVSFAGPVQQVVEIPPNAQQVPVPQNLPDGTYTVTITVTDQAGNVGTSTFTFIVDSQPPTVTFGTPSPAPNAAGWNNTDVSIPFTATDAGSGVASTSPATSPLVLTAEGAAVSGTVTATDKVGHSASFTSPTVKIDKTQPTTASSLTPGPNAAGWNNTEVSVSLGATDTTGGSGVKQITFSATGAQAIASTVVNGASASIPITTEGITTLSYFATDNADNAESAHTLVVKVDKTAPATTATPSPGPLPNGVPLVSVTASATVKDSTGATLGTVNPLQCWDSQGVVVGLAATDKGGGSGVTSLTYSASGGQVIATTTVTGSTASVPITAAGLSKLTYAAADSAGNQEATKSLSVFVGAVDDGKTLFACAAPTPTFAIPAHGSVLLTGTATVNGVSAPFRKTFKF